MKDNALLLVTGVICATCAWTLWHFLGSDAFDIMAIIALLSLSADNFRLRRILRRQKSTT